MSLAAVIRAARAVGELAGLVDAVQAIARLVKGSPKPADGRVVPLPHKDSERIAEFGRRAGHENDAPPSKSRYE